MSASGRISILALASLLACLIAFPAPTPITVPSSEPPPVGGSEQWAPGEYLVRLGPIFDEEIEQAHEAGLYDAERERLFAEGLSAGLPTDVALVDVLPVF